MAPSYLRGATWKMIAPCLASCGSRDSTNHGGRTGALPKRRPTTRRTKLTGAPKERSQARRGGRCTRRSRRRTTAPARRSAARSTRTIRPCDPTRKARPGACPGRHRDQARTRAPRPVHQGVSKRCRSRQIRRRSDTVFWNEGSATESRLHGCIDLKDRKLCGRALLGPELHVWPILQLLPMSASSKA
jgi:hypothetical protein